MKETIYLFKFLFPDVEDEKNQRNLTKNFNKSFLCKSILNGVTKISPPLTNNNTKNTTTPLLANNITPENIEEINDQYNHNITKEQEAINNDQNDNTSFDIEAETTIIQPESTNFGVVPINNNGINNQSFNNKLPGLSLSIVNNPNIENPYFSSNGVGTSRNNVEDENFQRTLSHDNNQIGSKSKLGKPLIPSLKLGNKGNNLGKNGSHEGILKINFDLQHKELSEQRRISGKL